MSLTHLAVRNFQSLRQVDLELGNFTVIVGPSSSGKSALIRAFKALTSNVRGAGVITRGQKVMAITGRTDTHTVTLQRQERSGSYRITDATGTRTYTKLAGEVPEHVTQALRIDPVGEGGSLNFASQFDKPYLLDESGATVARVLGELTNVTTIFAAVRAANRIRANAASTLKTRTGDMDRIKSNLGAYTALSGQLKALHEAEQLDARRQQLTSRIGRLDTAVRTLRISERAIAKAAVPKVPDITALNTAAARYRDLRAALDGVTATSRRAGALTAQADTLAQSADELKTALADMLRDAGICPTCQQSITA